MPHKYTLATTAVFSFGGTVCFDTWKHFDVLGAVKVIANVVAEGGLLVEHLVLPLCTTLVAALVWALAPRFEHLLGARTLLGDDEACVEVAIASGVIVLRFVGIQRHHDERLLGHVPVVEQPLERQVRVVKHDIRVHEKYVVMRLERFLHDGDLDPGAPAVVVVGSADELVVIAMHHGVDVVAQHASRESSNTLAAFPHELVVHELAGLGQRAAVNVDDQDFLPKVLPEPRLAVQAVYLAVIIGEIGGVDGMQDGLVEGLDDRGHGRVTVGEGDVVGVWVSFLTRC